MSIHDTDDRNTTLRIIADKAWEIRDLEREMATADDDRQVLIDDEIASLEYDIEKLNDEL
jgi:predicted  nucleic acid-binding Zn-ribbon protein